MDDTKPPAVSKQESNFCRYYLLWGNLREAAAAAGYPHPLRDGLIAIASSQVRRELARLRRQKSVYSSCRNGFRRLAFGSVTDAIRLLFAEEPPSQLELEQMDLFNVSEIKRPRGGGMEIKFFDRQKALERLCEWEEGSDQNGARAFYAALEKSARQIEGDT